MKAINEYGVLANIRNITKAVDRAEELLEKGDAPMPELLSLEAVLNQESDAMLILRRDQEYEPRLSAVIEKIKKASEEYNLPSLENKVDCWSINGVQYRNGIYTVDLLKTLLDNGSSKTQDGWAEFSEKAIGNKGFYVGDLPLQHAIFTTLFKNKNALNNDEIENIRKFLNDSMVKHWMMTLTRFNYTPFDEDIVIHNYGLQDKYEIRENIVGLDELVKNASDKKPYKAILGTDDTAEINAVYNWITGKDAYLWRVNSKPKKNDVRIARVDASTGRAILSCDGGPQSSDAAFGVRRRAKFFP